MKTRWKYLVCTDAFLLAGFSVLGVSSAFASHQNQRAARGLFSQQLGQTSLTQTSLRSQQAIDYTPLQQLLQAGKWQAANQLTSVLVLRAARQEQQGYLRATDTRKLACSDLQIIDRLWKTTSGGRFGFSAQATIWQNLKGNSYEDSLRFEQQVGWNSTQPQSIDNLKTVPLGYLPFRPAGKTGVMNAFGGWWIRELPLRLQQCRI